MNRCPVTLEFCGNEKYSKQGLALLSPKLVSLQDFPYTAKEQLEQAAEHASRLSIQGVQPKLSVKLNVSKKSFEIVDQFGTFIMKPPHVIYPELVENEDISMRLAKTVGIETPLHGMVYAKDQSLTYFIGRFDRPKRHHKIAVEDFAQLSGASRDTKYESSMERVAALLEKFCTFPLIEKQKLFRLTLFSYLIGNEDMHLKNFSLIRRNGKIELSPAYDLLNSSIVLNTQEELALPLAGKRSNLTRTDFVNYFGQERLGLSPKIIQLELDNFRKAIPSWGVWLEKSFLSRPMQKKYQDIVAKRVKILT
ncbi:MAG: HipA domain-containing protein [Myxococcaceae bacterium]